MKSSLVYLCQTDTTAGFLSQNLEALNVLKNRDRLQKCLITVSDLATLKEFVRVPKLFKNQVRKASKTTFIYPNGKALRLIKDERHLKFLRTIKWAYSTSANRHNQNFDLEFAKQSVDVIVDENFFQSAPSRIVKISKKRAKKIR